MMKSGTNFLNTLYMQLNTVVLPFKSTKLFVLLVLVYFGSLCNSYTMGCPPVRVDNPRALASGLSFVQVDKHFITILYHINQCRPCTSSAISC